MGVDYRKGWGYVQDIKAIVAKNIAALRGAREMTQLELAEKLNYSDKAVSKWERGESLPDITVLIAIADLFEVSLDQLLRPETDSQFIRAKRASRRRRKNHGFITGMCVVLVWLLAILLFIILDILAKTAWGPWLPFLYAIPATLVVWLIFNSLWFNLRRNFLIVSLLMWSVLGSLFITLFFAGFTVWSIFALGVPGQIIIWLWSKLRYKTEEN
ncbi:MAG: helix-turn-helix transcriptional regulator [Ruminococcaceae bacterium]|nr:helix-turn-helix transcriptional regulator [Oscillospiraceae bacterium]